MSKGLSGSGAWQMAQKNCAAKLVLLLVVRSIPMSLLRRKSCSALASTILSLISIVQKSFAPSFLNQSAGLLPGPLSFIFPNPLIQTLFLSTNRYRGGRHLLPSIGKFPDSGIGRDRGRRLSNCGYHRLRLMLWPRRWGWSR